MKLTHCLALSSLAACAAVSQDIPPRDPSLGRDNHISIYLGQRNLDEDDWEPVEEQPMFGIEYAHETYGSAVGFEVGIMGSKDDDEVGGVDVEGRTGELYGGIRKTFGEDVVRPCLGAGLSVIKAKAEVGSQDDDDSAAAVYAHGGISFFLSESFFIGLDLRILFSGDLEIAGSDVDADYGQLAFLMGFGF